MFKKSSFKAAGLWYWFLLLVAAAVVSSVSTVEARSSTATHPVKKTVIINEVMWMGSDKSSFDEWVELRNVSDQDIDLSGFLLENGGDRSDPNLVIPEGKIISANGYFLIANYEADKSALNVQVDWPTTDISLANESEQLTLRNRTGEILDQTPTPIGGKWAAGENGPPLFKSMERKRYPGNGTNPENWKTCTAGMCHFTSFWDKLGINWGTPKAPNL